MLGSGKLTNKTFFITAAGMGLGKRFAIQAAELGPTVALAGRRENLLQETTEEIRKADDKALFCWFDIRKPDEVEETFGAIVRETGHIDLLINNAAGNFISHAEDVSANGWSAVINIVLNGRANGTLTARRHMLKQGNGKVLHISAAYAWQGVPGNAHSAAVI